jgi:hypothetical protein
MRKLIRTFCLAPSLLLAGAGGIAVGTVIDVNTSETGTVTITPLGGPTAILVGGAPFGFCVGPNLDNCTSSGLTGSMTISSNPVAFTFSGGTLPATGTFVIQVSGLPGISNVTYSKGSLDVGSFGLQSFTNSSMTFIGSVNGGGFDAGFLIGSTISFNITTGSTPPPVPLPTSVIFVVTGLASVAMYVTIRRKGRIA